MTREKAINVLKQVISWRHDNLRGHPEMKYVAEAIEFIMSSLPPLPFNLNEAAEKWSDENAGSCDYIGVAIAESAFKAGAEWMARQMKLEQPEVDLEKVIEFNCIGRKVKMTIQELISYYIDTECVNTAIECGF